MLRFVVEFQEVELEGGGVGVLEVVESDLVFVLESSFHRREFNPDFSSLEFFVVLLFSELPDVIEELVIECSLAGAIVFELIAICGEVLNFATVLFIDECEFGELAAVVENLQADVLVLLCELCESSIGFELFIVVSSLIIGLSGAGVLKVVLSFFLASDFESSLIEGVFSSGSEFSELSLVVLNRCGLSGEFLLSIGRGVLFLLSGVEFQFAGAL